MTLSDEALELVKRLEAFQLRQLRFFARLQGQTKNETGAFAREETALAGGTELVREILPQVWDPHLRSGDLRELRKVAEEIVRRFVPILDDLEARLPDRPERGKKRKKPSLEGLTRPAAFHRAFEGPVAPSERRGASQSMGGGRRWPGTPWNLRRTARSPRLSTPPNACSEANRETSPPCRPW